MECGSLEPGGLVIIVYDTGEGRIACGTGHKGEEASTAASLSASLARHFHNGCQSRLLGLVHSFASPLHQLHPPDPLLPSLPGRFRGR
jgi:hypothetical protein